MAFIETVHESEAAGDLGALYKRFGNPDGTVDEVLKVHSLNPASLEAHCALYVQSMHTSSPVSRAEREMVGVVVSRINGCEYCLDHHARGLARLLRKDKREGVANMLAEGTLSGLNARERAIVAYAEKLTRTPGEIVIGDIAALREAGLEDLEILDVAQACAYFAYANRIALGLGAELEAESLRGQWPFQQGGRSEDEPAR